MNLVNNLTELPLVKIVIWFLFTFIAIQRINASFEDVGTKVPEIGFEPRPSYIPNNVVVLTFDDAPDFTNTAKVLDVLKQKEAPATFFINVKNWGDLVADAPMQALVRRIIDEGHLVGSHSATHPHLASLEESEIENQLVDVEEVVAKIGGENPPRVTLFRAPYGEPYQIRNPFISDPAYEKVAPIVARHAVHIGWNVNSEDHACRKGDAVCVLNNVKKSLKTPGKGNYGVIIMHCVHSQTAKALPYVIDYIRKNGFLIWTTEDVIRAKYGMTSEQLIYGSHNETDAVLPLDDDLSALI